MIDEALELIHGSGNDYRDLDRTDADARQLRDILASEIIKLFDEQGLTVRGAHTLTGIAAADFSRFRHANLSRFTVDRLTGIINKLGSCVEFTVRVEQQKHLELDEVA